MIAVSVIIPFRDRGTDPLRLKNLDRVLDHWRDAGIDPIVTSDGGTGRDQFNRSRAYNIGIDLTAADVLVLAESDILVPHDQVRQAVDAALTTPGLVVPFSEYRAMTPDGSEAVRAHTLDPQDAPVDMVIADCGSFGALNVISRTTYDAVGCYDEAFNGSWYDDNAMKHAFEVCAGPTRYVEGAAHHLYHLPGWAGDHLTDEDRAATDRNKARYEAYVAATSAEEIRHLTAGN